MQYMDTRFPYVTAIFFFRLTDCLYSHCSSMYILQSILYTYHIETKTQENMDDHAFSPRNKHHLPFPSQTHHGSQYSTTKQPTGISINHAGHVSPCGVHYSEYQSFSKRQNNNQYSTPNSYLGLEFFSPSPGTYI